MGLHRVLLGALAMMLVVSATAGSASAATDAPDEAALAPEAPGKAVELMRVTRKIEGADRQMAEARQRLVSADTALQMTNDQISTNQAQIDVVQRRIRAQAALA